MISLYRVIGRIGMMILDLGMVNEGSDTGGRTWDRVRDVSVKIRCPHNSGVGICTRLHTWNSQLVLRKSGRRTGSGNCNVAYMV